ncbi:MAG: ABC transporter permease subunit [Chthoniobacterales bacterium]
MFRWNRDRWFWAGAIGLGLLPVLAIVGLAIFLFWNAAGASAAIGLRGLAGTEWLPPQGRYGVTRLLAGTLAVTGLALCLAVPIALSAAGYLSLYAGRRVRAAANTAIGLLGGIPSVVIGLWGMTWIVPFFGNSWTSASLVLALMIAPTITLLAGAALRLVPADLLEASRALGVGEAIVSRVAFHHARWGILGAVVLGTSRALGEAVAVSMVAGNVVAWPNFTRPIATLTTTLIVELDSAAGLHRDALYLLACLVLIAISTLSVFGRAAQRRAGI